MLQKNTQSKDKAFEVIWFALNYFYLCYRDKVTCSGLSLVLKNPLTALISQL